MVYREDTLVAGALEALVRHAIPTAEYFPEDAYMFAFILCARMFVPLEEVSTGDERRCAALGRNVLRFLREWSDSFAYDYREERMMALCIEVTQRLVELLPDARREVSELQTDLLAKLTAVETYEEFLNRCGDVRYVDSVEELTAVSPRSISFLFFFVCVYFSFFCCGYSAGGAAAAGRGSYFPHSLLLPPPPGGLS
ncbi:hypothetical protein ONE63_003189 [Megalurothrips usitatus]|uniref:N-terminal Ras-GEF domain-containing protein n=1 Tax=Megalurothrips usitatus TaxID=439358 RepID=A0AAV7XD36_9NEOP|nr:hypothetical protein ONE63_003189 [Megalurothrips usitatus]